MKYFISILILLTSKRNIKTTGYTYVRLQQMRIISLLLKYSSKNDNIMWLHNLKEYYLVLNILLSSFSVLCEEYEKGIVESDDVRFPDDELPNNIQTYPSYQTICTDSPHYKKLADRVTTIFLDFEEKYIKLENQVNKLTEDLKMCNAMTAKLDADFKDVKTTESTFKGKVDEKIEAIEKKLKKYISKLSDAEKEIEDLDTNVSNRNKQLIDLEDKYENVEDSMKKIKREIEEIGKKTEGQDQSLDEEIKKVAEITTTLFKNMTEFEENMALMKEEQNDVALSLKQLSLERTLSDNTDVEPTVVKVPDQILEIKRLAQLINSADYWKRQEISFVVTEDGVKSNWKFYLTVMTDKNKCQGVLKLEHCQFIGAYVRLISSSQEKIVAKFEITLQDIWENPIKTQKSSLKEFKPPSMKFGWPKWISILDLQENIDRSRDVLQFVLKLELYPEGSYLYDQNRTSETTEIDWPLPDIQMYLPDRHSKNLSRIFTVGQEMGVHTEWRVYLENYENYVKVGVQLLKSTWNIVYASWMIDIHDFDDNKRASSSTYAKAYQPGGEAIKDSQFLLVDKLQSWKQRDDSTSITLKIKLTVYGKVAKVPKDVMT